MNKISHALIMAAGRGARMMPITENIPKAMVAHKGSTLIAIGIDRIKKHIENVHITVGHKKAMLAQHVISHDVSSIFNTEGKGNAWWIYNTALKHLNEPVFVLTCDNVTEIDFDRLAADYFEKQSPPCMVVPVRPVAGLEGDYIFKEAAIVRELSREKRSDLYCSGIQILNPAAINALTSETQDFNHLWHQLIEKQLLLCSDVLPDKWFAVDNIEQLQRLALDSTDEPSEIKIAV